MARKKRRSKAGRPRGTTGLSTASLADLQAELRRREEAVEELQSRREQLVAELEAIDQEILEHGGTVTRRRGRPRGTARRGPGRPPKVGRPRGKRAGGRRPRNAMSLVDALHGVLQGKTMSVTDVSEAVQKSGYRTTSANFRTIVNQALITNPNRFKKVSRGQYTAK